MSKPVEKTAKKTKLNEFTPDSIKEKSYVTRQVDTSISILESPENEVVLESLLFLSKYADIKLSNLTYLQQKGITQSILNLLDRNICILRLTLRLLSVLLEKTPIICEIDQEEYDEKLLEIANLYITHNDKHVREFCVDILSTLAKSCRITCLIFKENLFPPILDTIRHSKSISFLLSTLNFLNYLLDSPAALSSLLVEPNFEVNAITTHIRHEDFAIREKAYQILLKITSKDIRAFQKMFKENQLVEKMMDVVMDPNKKDMHHYALGIIQNCLNSEETSTYYIKSTQFISFCFWTKNCDSEYALSCAEIFEKLTNIPSIKQILYDLSVEESILYLLRCKEKNVLLKTCKAITNMTLHKYCCEDMLTSVVIKVLIENLKKDDDVVDCTDEVVLETIYSFFIRSSKAISLLYENEIVPILMHFFTKTTNLSEESYLRVLEMLYKFSMICDYQQSVLCDNFFEKLFILVDSKSDELSQLSIEILIHFIGCKKLNSLILSKNGTKMLLDKLKSTTNKKVMKYLLLLIHNALLFDDIAICLLKSGLMRVIRSLPETFVTEAPIVDTIIRLAYKTLLPLKFYETGKLEMTEKLCNNFYVVCGRIIGPFPFIELFKQLKVSTMQTIYVVDYSYEVKKDQSTEKMEEIKTVRNKYQPSFIDSTAKLSSSQNSCEVCVDPYLPRYIQYVASSIQDGWSLNEKIQFLATYIDKLLCGPVEDESEPDKIHSFKLHIESLKFKLSTSVIPIGFLRIGFRSERALMFKAIGDRVNIPCTLEHNSHVTWNETALMEKTETGNVLNFYVIDLVNDVGTLLPSGSKEANKYVQKYAQ